MKTTTFLCLALLAAAGCKTSVNTLEPAQPAAQRQVLADKRVITDSSLNNAVRPIGMIEAAGPGGFLKIQVDLQNVTRSIKRFSYRVEWFDENGMLITQATTSSVSKSLEGGEISSITAVSPTPFARDFRIKFIEPVN